MRYAVLLKSAPVLLACAGTYPPEAVAGPIVLAQAEGGGIGGSLSAPETRTIRAKPRSSRAAAVPRAAPAPRVIVKREVVYEPRYVTRPAPAPRRSARSSDGLGIYDGAWTVSVAGPCSVAGNGQFVVSGGRITSSSGSGTVSSGGEVNTVSAFNGLTIVARGQMNSRSASGVYRQSDGCTSSWSAAKL